MFEVVCSAVLTPGKITQRVSRVRLPTREARRLIAEAWKIAHPPKPAARRARKAATPRPSARPYRVIAISVYEDDLAAIDAFILSETNSGRRTTRSGLFRSAMRLAGVS